MPASAVFHMENCMKSCPLALTLAAAFPLLAHGQTQAPQPEPTLKPVIVTAPDGSPLQSTSSATRTAIPAEQLPQSVISINRRALDDQDAQNLPQALRSVSSVVAVDPRDTFNIQPRIRGFNAATLVDGVAMPSLFSNLDSTINIEQLDVIKGPASGVAGGGQSAGGYGFMGGALAVQTKSPTAATSREVGVRIGSYSERGLYADINQPVNDLLGLRLVAESQSNGDEAPGSKTTRQGLYPSLSLKPNGQSELLVKARLSRLTNLDNSGQPAQGTVLPADYSVPRNLRVTAQGQPQSQSNVDSLSMHWKQSLADGWSYDVNGSRLISALNQYGAYTDDLFFGGTGPTYQLRSVHLQQNVNSTNLSANLYKDLQAGVVTHRLLIALDLSQTTDVGYVAGGILGDYDITSPNSPTWVTPATPAQDTWQNNTYASQAITVQDHISIGPRLHLQASMKYTHLNVDNQWLAAGASSNTTYGRTTPRLGIIYEMLPGISAFAGYGESFSVPTNANYTTTPQPESAKQVELGIKLKGSGGVTANIAWFDLRRTNVPTADPNNAFQTIQTGEQRSTGIDMDAQWQINRTWSLQGHLTVQDPRITADTTLTVGNQLFDVPKRSARLGVRHSVSQRLAWALAANYSSKRPGDAANTFFTPAATVWDAQMQYTQSNVRYAASINNLTDKKYYVPSAYFGGGHVLPAPRRQLSLTASYIF
jgi:iron complex outermembrane recepter protein